jgi:hypothetical protein
MLPPDAMPGGCHPAYERDADFIRQCFTRKGDVIKVPYWVGPTLIYREGMPPYPNLDDVMKTHILTRKKAAGPVPAVGPRQMLWWWVFTDELGRSVAANRVYRATDVHGWIYGGIPAGWPEYSSWFDADDSDVVAGWA